jgi:uncharacterized protein
MTDESFLEVMGVGHATAVPDVLHAHLAGHAVAATVGEAFEKANTASRQMAAALRSRGVADADLRTTEIHLYPAENQKLGIASGYSATVGVQAVLRDLSDAGTVLAAVVAAGGDASRVNGVSLAHSAPQGALTEARAAAWEDAVSQAEHYASLAARSLGPIRSIREEGYPGHSRIVPLSGRADAYSAAHIEAGREAVTIAVTVRWELV